MTRLALASLLWLAGTLAPAQTVAPFVGRWLEDEVAAVPAHPATLAAPENPEPWNSEPLSGMLVHVTFASAAAPAPSAVDLPLAGSRPAARLVQDEFGGVGLAAPAAVRLAEVEFTLHWGDWLAGARDARLFSAARQLATSWLLVDRWWPFHRGGAEADLVPEAGGAAEAPQGEMFIRRAPAAHDFAWRFGTRFDAGTAHLHTGGVVREVDQAAPDLVGTTAEGWFASASWVMTRDWRAVLRVASYDTNRFAPGRETEMWTLGLDYRLRRPGTRLSVHYLIREGAGKDAASERVQAGLRMDF